MKVGVDVAICGSMEVVKAGVDVDVDVDVLVAVLEVAGCESMEVLGLIEASIA